MPFIPNTNKPGKLQIVGRYFECTKDLSNREGTFTKGTILKCISVCTKVLENILAEKPVDYSYLTSAIFIDKFNNELVKSYTNLSNDFLLKENLTDSEKF